MPLWKREEVQEVLRDKRLRVGEGEMGGVGDHALIAHSSTLPLPHSLALVAMFFIASSASAAIWPDQFAGYQKTETKAPAIADRAVWDEYGLDASEQATYELGKKSFTATAWRLKDPTGALAAFQWLQPEGAKQVKLGDYAVETAKAALAGYGNYVLRFDGYKPKPEEIQSLTLTRLDQSALPALTGYLPSQGLVPGSQRYVTGPASLERFEPQVPPSVAAFRMGTEAQIAKYKAKGGEMRLAIFSYPTPDLARERKADFDKLPGALVKRTGPMLAVIFSPSDPDAAERLLAKVEYQPAITASERVPTRRDNIGDLILNIFQLTGILLVLGLGAGIMFGFIRLWGRRFGTRSADEAMITLHLEDR